MNRIQLRYIFFKEKKSVLFNTKPCLLSSKVEHVCEQLSPGAAHHRSYSTKVYSPLRPIISFNNFVYGQLTRGYFKQDFHLHDFCQTCPRVVKTLIDSLSSEDTDHLCDVVEPACLENLMKNWKEMSDHNKKYMTDLTEKEILWKAPTVRMRLPGASDASKEIMAHLNIQIIIFYLVKLSELNEIMQDQFKAKIRAPNSVMLKMLFPIIHPFEFEREVTKGVDGSWRLESCGTFPSVSLKIY